MIVLVQNTNELRFAVIITNACFFLVCLKTGFSQGLQNTAHVQITVNLVFHLSLLHEKISEKYIIIYSNISDIEKVKKGETIYSSFEVTSAEMNRKKKIARIIGFSVLYQTVRLANEHFLLLVLMSFLFLSKKAFVLDYGSKPCRFATI